MKKSIIAATAFTVLSIAATSSALARTAQYQVTVTNITKGQTFTPILSASHKNHIRVFSLGEPASPQLADLAESGNVSPLQEVLDNAPNLVKDTTVSPGLLGPGESATFTIDAGHRFKRFSMAAMLIPTNDTFVAINSVRFPAYGSKTVFAEAYDAGSEANNELCASMPGPFCQGEGASPEDAGDEGFVHIAAGVHGDGDLAESVYDWRSSVAKVTIKRMY